MAKSITKSYTKGCACSGLHQYDLPYKPMELGVGSSRLYSGEHDPRCRWVCFFMVTDMERSSAVNGCRQNESPSINPHHSSLSVNILWSEKLHVCRKQIHHEGILTLKCCFWPKYESIIHYTSFSAKVTLSDSVERYAQRKHHLKANTV